MANVAAEPVDAHAYARGASRYADPCDKHLAAAGRRGPAERGRTDTAGSAHQAAVLGVAADSVFGLTAALMKGMTGIFADGFCDQEGCPHGRKRAGRCRDPRRPR